MKMTGLGEAIKGFDGKPILEATGGEPKPLTIKSALLMSLGQMRRVGGVEHFHVQDFGTSLFRAKDGMEGERGDIALLRIAVEQNAPGFSCLIQDQLLRYVGSVVEKKKDAESNE